MSDPATSGAPDSPAPADGEQRVVLLAGGTGGAKLARGLLDVVGADRLTVIANTADDIEIYGGYVSPDPDLITFWLADRIDDRGWGIRDDTFHVMEGLRELGAEIWFNLGDRDLAIAIRRAEALEEGRTLTEAHAELTAALGVRAEVLPMTDQPVRTRVLADGRWWPFQEFMIKARGQGPVQDVNFANINSTRPSRSVLRALDAAVAIVIGPSNPFISIGPILDLPGMRSALKATPAPLVAVSPLVHNQVVKGPTDVFMAWSGTPMSSDGIAEIYGGLIDGLVADEATEAVPTLQTNVLMDTPDARRTLAEQTLRFARSLA